MRKLSLVFIALAAAFASWCQTPLPKIAESYFRSDPFKTNFSSFLNHLFNDPTIVNKVLEKRTDTSLFYFEGTYTKHNPFFFKPTSVKIVLAETAIQLDSVTTDTIYLYQLLAFDNDTKEGMQELKKEFDKIYKRYKSSFTKADYREHEAGDKVPAATYNFFDDFHAVSPFGLTWYGPDEKKETCLVLTIRMVAKNNRAMLPAPFYSTD